jgi:hypothetical protein
MANLIKCRTCGHEIVPRADPCPNCGERVPNAERLERINKFAANWAPWLALGSLVLMAVGCIIAGFLFTEYWIWRIIWFGMAGFLFFVGIGGVLGWYEEK